MQITTEIFFLLVSLSLLSLPFTAKGWAGVRKGEGSDTLVSLSYFLARFYRLPASLLFLFRFIFVRFPLYIHPFASHHPS